MAPDVQPEKISLLGVDVASSCDWTTTALVERNPDGTIVIAQVWNGLPTERDIAKLVKEKSSKNPK